MIGVIYFFWYHCHALPLFCPTKADQSLALRQILAMFLHFSLNNGGRWRCRHSSPQQTLETIVEHFHLSMPRKVVFTCFHQVSFKFLKVFGQFFGKHCATDKKTILNWSSIVSLELYLFFRIVVFLWRSIISLELWYFSGDLLFLWTSIYISSLEFYYFSWFLLFL